MKTSIRIICTIAFITLLTSNGFSQDSKNYKFPPIEFGMTQDEVKSVHSGIKPTFSSSMVNILYYGKMFHVLGVDNVSIKYQFYSRNSKTKPLDEITYGNGPANDEVWKIWRENLKKLFGNPETLGNVDYFRDENFKYTLIKNFSSTTASGKLITSTMLYVEKIKSY